MTKPCLLVVHPGAVISTADVHSGLVAGLKAHGAQVVNYALHGRLNAAEKTLAVAYRIARRQAKKEGRVFTQAPPEFRDVCYQACADIFERIFRFRVDGIIFVSGVLIPRDVIRTIKNSPLPIGLLLTESPYLSDAEMDLARLVDVVWTNERSFVDTVRTIQPKSYYLPHAWLPGVHDKVPTFDVATHDVVFVGTGFPERVAFLEAVDWTGIDLGLYGNWRSLREDSPLKPFVRHQEIQNTRAAALYRKAKIGLNLYRTSTASNLNLYASDLPKHITYAESLNPRAYELAATGSFHLSTARAEVVEKFGPLVPTFETPDALGSLLRHWLAHDTERQAIAARLPALVAEDTWIARGGQVLGGMRGVMRRAA